MMRPIPILLTTTLLLALLACTTPPTAAPPTQEADPSGEPHSWQALPVLVELWTAAVETLPEYAWSSMPNLVLYADGRAVVTRYDASPDGFTRSIREARLSTEEVCTLLTQIEADGFFDFGPADYEPPSVMDGSVTSIAVEAWRSQRVEAYGLSFALEEEGDGSVPPALAATYQRLNTYEPPNSQPYQPERVALRIATSEGASEGSPPSWPLANLSLVALLERASSEGASGDEQFVLLEGAEATEVYALFGEQINREYSEEGQLYSVTMRPLLPLEQWNEENPWLTEPYVYPTTSATELTCES